MSDTFPVDLILTRLRTVLRAGTDAVVHAPPGAGKTTRIPPALLHEPWMAGKRLILLEPRRLAARAAARFMARAMGEPVGATVGYRMRDDTRVGPATRIEVVTEGVLARMLHDDPSLPGVGCLVFDEFHERSLQTDLGLALALDARAAFREDLRFVVMSATLAAEAVSRLLGDAPIVRSDGRMFDVETRYLDHAPRERIESVAAAAVRRALADDPGDVLVFLPGQAEIRRTAELLAEVGAAGSGGSRVGEDRVGPAVDVRPLYGALTGEEQDAAIAPSPPGRRKVVLATDIAETSLTIEGVRIVVDSGLVRSPAFSPASGMTRLVTLPCAVSSADQRRGRAGRLAPGVAWRLWTRFDHEHRPPFAEPEIVRADLAPLALDLAAWGVRDPGSLRWLDPPPAAAWSQAVGLLTELGALDADCAITAHGRAMAGFAAHPRLAHMILSATKLGLSATACDLAALVEEAGSIGGGPSQIDVRLDLQRLRSGAGSGFGGAVDRVRREADRLRRQGGKENAAPNRPERGAVKHPGTASTDSRAAAGGDRRDPEAAGLLLALAYPDRVAQRIGEGRFRLANGRNADLDPRDPLSASPFLAIAELGGTGLTARIFRAAPVTREDLESVLPGRIATLDEVRWNQAAERVEAVRETRIGAVVLRSAPLKTPDPEAVADTLLAAIRERGAASLPWTKASRQLQERLVFLARRHADWPDVSDTALLTSDLLRPFLHGMTRWSDLTKLDLQTVLLSGLDFARQRELDRRAPTHVNVPSGSRIPIDYSDPDAPVLAVRLQEVFGLTETPTVDGLELTMHLLSPAHRPVQVTRDLASFWREAYFDVRKDLRGRYPKHFWPENPLEAEPTARAKPRR